MLSLVACGGAAKKTSTVRAATTPVVKITAGAGQYRIEAPSSLKNGLVKLELYNADRVGREAQLIRVDGGHTLDDAFRRRIVPQPTWLNNAGGVGSTKPGQTRTTIQELPAGKYYVIDGNAKSRNAVRDAGAPLVVTGGGVTAGLPAATATISIGDRPPGFLTTALRAGSQMVLIDNTGSTPAGVALVPIVPGKSLADVRRYIQSGTGPLPLDVANAVLNTPLEGGAAPVTQQITQINLRGGTRYALTSFVLDRDYRATHAKRGLVSEVDVPWDCNSSGKEDVCTR